VNQRVEFIFRQSQEFAVLFSGPARFRDRAAMMAALSQDAPHLGRRTLID
jgi:hypothetical protein